MAQRNVTPELLAVARGDAPADLLLRGARVVNVFTRTVEPGSVAIHADRIAAVLPEGERCEARESVDLHGSFIAPGFIDAHMHVESTMLPPSEFVRLALPHGTTGAVFDPHEIANVLGLAGIRFLMDNAIGLPFNAMWAVSSCVPSSPLETAGAELSADDLAPLFDDDRVVALAEMMNFPGVVNAVPEVLAKVDLGLRRRLVDGHAPGLTGRALQAYVAAGVSSDHECTTPEEAAEKLALGMRVYIREGSAARNLDALLPLVTPANAHLFSFCTDDRHPGDLRDEGHIDHVVRRAIGAGLDPATAIAMGSLHTARHYRQPDLGAVAPGCGADLIVFDDLNAPHPRMVFHHATLVAQDGRYLGPQATLGEPPRATVRLPELSEASFRVPASGAGRSIRVIDMDPHQLITEEAIERGVTDGRAYVVDVERDVLKLVVIERHNATGNIGRGFVRGFGLKRGALASTVGHDSHNLAIVGTNDADMLGAARALESAGGGQCVVADGALLALLPLPIAGLMSDQPAERVIERQRALLDAAGRLGCPHHDPFMPLSFMPLPVIPKLKLSDLGLVDVDRFEVVSLEV
jgi:adenine deaminase